MRSGSADVPGVDLLALALLVLALVSKQVDITSTANSSASLAVAAALPSVHAPRLRRAFDTPTATRHDTTAAFTASPPELRLSSFRRCHDPAGGKALSATNQEGLLKSRCDSPAKAPAPGNGPTPGRDSVWYSGRRRLPLASRRQLMVEQDRRGSAMPGPPAFTQLITASMRAGVSTRLSQVGRPTANPLDPRYARFYRTVGNGIRYRFDITASSDRPPLARVARIGVAAALSPATWQSLVCSVVAVAYRSAKSLAWTRSSSDSMGPRNSKRSRVTFSSEWR